jgi:hypothetical protein
MPESNQYYHGVTFILSTSKTNSPEYPLRTVRLKNTEDEGEYFDSINDSGADADCLQTKR